MPEKATVYTAPMIRLPYGEFKANDRIECPINSLNPDGSIRTEVRFFRVKAIKDGGFFGRVLITDDCVIKTTTPDPWHDLWRRVNWGLRRFPSQTSEPQAQLDYLSSNLIADVLPPLTDNQVRSPHSLGYSLLPNGFAQVAEEMHGRPPRFDTNNNEFQQFRQRQALLRKLGFDLGLEHAAQVHENNPFGMANLWRAEDGTWIWLDTLPAIPHKGFIFPFFYFRFHKEVRDWFYPDKTKQQITFNKIHTDKFRSVIQREHHRFTNQLYSQIEANLKLHDQLLENASLQTPIDLPGVIKAGAFSVLELAKKPFSLAWHAVTKPINLILNPESVLLGGVQNAQRAGIISSEELDRIKSGVSNDLSVFNQLAVFYHGFGSFVSIPLEVYVASNILGLDPEKISGGLRILSYLASQIENPQKIAELLIAYSSIKGLGSVVRFAGTEAIARAHNKNLSLARNISTIPLVGDYLATVVQFARTCSNIHLGKEVLHYTIRNLTAKMSALLPDGGWGTQREGELWLKIGQPLESLLSRNRSPIKQPQI